MQVMRSGEIKSLTVGEEEDSDRDGEPHKHFDTHDLQTNFWHRLHC